jgi:hypothetical protein
MKHSNTMSTPAVQIRRRRAVLVVVLAIALAGSPAGDAPASALTTPVLQAQASSSGYPVGTPIFDAVDIRATNPAGTLTFRLHGILDPNCTNPPVFTSSKAVNGNGYYQSDSFVPLEAGTYRWVASYGGDARNAAVTSSCNDPAQAVAVAKRMPLVEGSASSGTGGRRLVDVANLRNGVGPSGPTGTITFDLYGPDNMVCSGPPVFTSVKPVSGNGAYTSDPFKTRVPGTYRWIVTYSGDANNMRTQTSCSDTAQAVLVPPFSMVSDFDGDGDTDPAVFRPGGGHWFIRDSSPRAVAWGTGGDVPVAGDFDANGIIDPAIFRPTTGQWFINDSRPRAISWGTATDIPVPGDFDGDGDTDPAIFRPNTGQWFINDSRPRAVSWGTVGDLPVPGDFDGDGDTDPAIFRPTTGQWFINDSRPRSVGWGATGDLPIPGDYDADGDSDLAIFRPATGQWFINDSRPRIVSWGILGDLPVPGDYDGDGSFDTAIFRPTTGEWFVNDSRPWAVPWGTTRDIPVMLPAAVRQISALLFI